MGFWDNLKSFGGDIWGGIKKVGGKVLDIGRKARDIVSGGWEKLQKIPVIGKIAENLASRGIPILGGQSLKDIAKTASDVLDVGESVATTGKSLEAGDLSKTGAGLQDVRERIRRLRKPKT